MSVETSSKFNKFHKKVKLAIGGLKKGRTIVKTLGSDKKGFRGYKKAETTSIEENAVDVSYDNDKLYKTEKSGRRNMRLNTKEEHIHSGRDAKFDRNSGFKSLNLGHKRKRVYADYDKADERMLHKNVDKPKIKALTGDGWNKVKDNVGEERTTQGKSRDFERSRKRDSSIKEDPSYKNGVLDNIGSKKYKNVDKPKGKALSGDGWNKVKDDVGEEKRTTQGKSHYFERSRKRDSPIREEPSCKNEVLDNIGSKKLTAKAKVIDKMEGNRDDSRSSLLKRDAQNKSNTSKQFNQNQNRSAADILDKFGKKKFRGKKSLNGGSAVDDDQPTKSKRVIRIDPRDVTNKRLDDGIVNNENIKDEKQDLQQNDSAEMSKNAQFRAIQPSPYILSFVEDNLLGRRRLIELRRMGYNTELSAPLDNIAASASSERERIEEPIFRNKLEFFAAAKISSSFPPPDFPEIAFAGRSNVGKSSLLNALTRQWGVVRTSDKPGLTQTINFFKLGSKVSLVDLPGYGFAYAKEEVKEAWEELVKEYVSTRVGLKRVCLLVDTKWGMKPRDHELIELMERSQTNYQIVLTKTDLVFPIDVARRAMQIEESLKAKKSAVQPVMMISSKSGAGIRSLRTVLAKIARFTKL